MASSLRLLIAALACGAAAVLGAVQAQPLSVPAANQAARAERQRIAQREWRRDGHPALLQLADARLSDDAAVLERGRQLYEQGRRADGTALTATRLNGQIRLSGERAACVLCHRRSGLGAVEGVNLIQPVAGRYLFDQDRRALTTMNFRGIKSFSQRHDPYTLAALGQALRQGRSNADRELDELMPRYALSDDEVYALASHLRRLSNQWSPGVSDTEVRLATIVTPDADPQQRRIFLKTVQAIVAQKNGNLVHGQRTMSSGAEMALRTDRSWRFEVWELSGPSSTWAAQLNKRYQANPVFAVVSGLGLNEWQPVHDFCESRRVPCWFPSVAAAPQPHPGDFYGVYFSRGVGLEADVLARHLHDLAPEQRPQRVLALAATASVERLSVEPLRSALAGTGIQVESLVWGSVDNAGLRSRVESLGARDVLAVWLDPQQLRMLVSSHKPRVAPYFSASLGGAESMALPRDWRATARLLYPYQLPAARREGLTVFREWLKHRKLPLENEVLQSEVYFAFDYFNDTLVEMLDNVHRDHLLERGENMLSLREGQRSEDQARGLSLPKVNLVPRNVPANREFVARSFVPRAASPGPQHAALPAVAPLSDRLRGSMPMAPSADAPADDADDADMTGMASGSGAPESTNVYPRLSLAQSQRFASKGAYIVGWTPEGELSALSRWLVP